MKNLLFALLILSNADYEKALVHEIAVVINQHKECTQTGYDKIYKNIAILQMMHMEKDFRYDAVTSLRERCNGMISSYENKGLK